MGLKTKFLQKEKGYPNQDIFKIDLKKFIDENNIDFNYNVVVIGGGASLDYGKVIASRICAEISRTFLINLLLIPTNIGSAAEITSFSTVWDYESGKKLSVEIHKNVNRTVLYDTNSLRGISESSKITGLLDAISHTFDSLNSKDDTYLLKQLATNNIEIGINALETLRLNPSKDSIEVLQSVSTIGGICIDTTKTSITHGLSYGLTLSYNIPHGLAVGLVLKTLLNRSSLDKFLNLDSLLKIKLVSELNKIDFRSLVNISITSLNTQKLISQVDTNRINNFRVSLTEQEIMAIFRSIERELIL